MKTVLLIIGGITIWIVLILPSTLGEREGTKSPLIWNWDLSKGSKYRAIQLKRESRYTIEWHKNWNNLFLYYEWRRRSRETIIQTLWISIIIIILVQLLRKKKSFILGILCFVPLCNGIFHTCVDRYRKAYSIAYHKRLITHPRVSTQTKVRILNQYIALHNNLPYKLAQIHDNRSKLGQLIERYKHTAPKGAGFKDLLIYLITGIVGIIVIISIIKIRMRIR